MVAFGRCVSRVVLFVIPLAAILATTACSDSDLACGVGTADCGGICVATMEDPANCGACGNACAAGQVCAAGTCAAECTAGQVSCDGACVDTWTNAAHCGGCDQPCATGDVCVEGGCTACGNGVWDPGEQCDDGNNVSGDGCTAACAYEGPPGSITYAFTAVIVSIVEPANEFAGSLTVGDPVVGRYTIDPTLVDQVAATNEGFYSGQFEDPRYGVKLEVAGQSYAPGDGQVQLYNNLGTPAVDYYNLMSHNGTVPPTWGTQASWDAFIELADPSATALVSDAQPVAPIDVSAWSQSGTSGLRIYQERANGPAAMATLLWVGP